MTGDPEEMTEAMVPVAMVAATVVVEAAVATVAAEEATAVAPEAVTVVAMTTEATVATETTTEEVVVAVHVAVETTLMEVMVDREMTMAVEITSEAAGGAKMTEAWTTPAEEATEATTGTTTRAVVASAEATVAATGATLLPLLPTIATAEALLQAMAGSKSARSVPTSQALSMWPMSSTKYLRVNWQSSFPVRTLKSTRQNFYQMVKENQRELALLSFHLLQRLSEQSRSATDKSSTRSASSCRSPTSEPRECLSRALLSSLRKIAVF